MFIGGFQHPPNTDAVLWYAQRGPAARARSAARRQDVHRGQQGAGDRSRALAARRFRRDRLRARRRRRISRGCRVSIAPLRYGAGVKGKINLAMSYGLPVVATTPSIEGMHLVARATTCSSPTTPRPFADAIVRALRRRGAVGARSRRAAARTSARTSRATSRAARSRGSSPSRDGTEPRAPRAPRLTGPTRKSPVESRHASRRRNTRSYTRVAELAAARLELGLRPPRRAAARSRPRCSRAAAPRRAWRASRSA